MLDAKSVIKGVFKEFRPGYAFSWTLICGLGIGWAFWGDIPARESRLYLFIGIAVASLPWIPLLLDALSGRISSEIFSDRAAVHRDFHTATKLLSEKNRWAAAAEFERLFREKPSDLERLYRLAEVTWTELGDAHRARAFYLELWERIRQPSSRCALGPTALADRLLAVASRLADIHYLGRDFSAAERMLSGLLDSAGCDLREKADSVRARLQRFTALRELRPSTLVLFDIDGTLSNSGGAGGRAVAAAFEEVYGKKVDLESIDFRGRTDISLWREILSSHGLSYSPDDPYLGVFQNAYLTHLRRMLLNSGPSACPGVRSLLERLEREPTVALGLLTGNIEAGGRTKIQAVELNRFFPVGGFGEDGEDRVDIARVSVRRCGTFYGVEISPERVFVVGDAESDIGAARAIGARAISVATGWTAVEDLLRLNPDYFFEDLRQSATFLKIIGIEDPRGHRLSVTNSSGE